MGNRYGDHVTPLYPQKLALTSPTGGGRSVGIVRSRTKATEFSLALCSRVRASWVIVNDCPTRCDYTQFYYFSGNSSTCFGWSRRPSSGAHVNCNYSIWHWSNRICYRPLTWRSRNCRSYSTTSAESSKYGSTCARCCNYSLRLLLMMGDGITRNM